MTAKRTAKGSRTSKANASGHAGYTVRIGLLGVGHVAFVID